MIPVATGASQARDFQAQDGSAMLESDFSDQRLKAIATKGGSARVALVLVNDMNALAGPSQALGPVHQVVLAHGAGGVVTHLHQRRLPHIDHRVSIQMVKLDLVE